MEKWQFGRYALYNAGLLLFACTWHRLLRSPTDGKQLHHILLEILILGLIVAVPWIGLSAVYQVAVRALVRKWVKRWQTWLFVFLLPGILLTASAVYESLPKVRAAHTLRDGRLASLPRTATRIRNYSWSALFTGESYLKFQASDSDIEKFIRNSPSLSRVKPRVYSKSHVHIPSSVKSTGSQTYETHDNFDSFNDPKWFSRELRDTGRVFEIPSAPNGHNNGWVIVDDIRHVVYIYVFWS